MTPDRWFTKYHYREGVGEMLHSAYMLASECWSILVQFASRHLAILVPLSWAVSAVGAVFAYFQNRQGAPFSFRALLKFCVPAEIVRHRSLRLDLAFSAVLAVLSPLIIAPILIANVVFATFIYHGLSLVFGPAGQADPGWALRALTILLCVIVQDCATFHIHYACHKLGLLWETHKVHHSTEVLIPISGRRIHPLEQIIDVAGTSLAVGLVLGLLSYACGLRLQDNLLAGGDAYFVFNIFSFYHLRHSHVRFTFGRLEYVLMSPTQHQIHHAYDHHLWDKNFGQLLSIWDQLWGTIVYSRQAVTFKVGLPEAYRAGYNSVWKLYLTPFRNIGLMIGRWVAGPFQRRTSAPLQVSEASMNRP